MYQTNKLTATLSTISKGGKYGSSGQPVIKKKREEMDNSSDLIWELFDAISEGNTANVGRIVKEATKPHALLARKDLQGLTPLKKAITLNKADVASVLVSHGASPSVKDPVGKTPLHIAVMQGRRELMAPLLVSADSSVNVQDNAGWTPLHYAVRGKHLKALEWLLYAGADIHIKNKDDETPLDAAEEDALMTKMLKAHNLDRDLFPVELSSAFISRKSLNIVGTDGLLMFVTSHLWSPHEQFFFCKRIRPMEARPLLPLRWNEYFYSDVYHYRTMRQLTSGETRVKVFILFFEDLKYTEIVLKVTSKDKYLGEVPLMRSTYIQDKYTNYMGSCELDIKPEGQFAVVKRSVSMQLRKNEDGVYATPKFNNFLIDMPQGTTPGAPKDWNNQREERALKEKSQMLAKAQLLLPANSMIDYLQEFIDLTASQEPQPTMSTKNSGVNTPVIKVEKVERSSANFRSMDEEGEFVEEPSSNKVSEMIYPQEPKEVPLEPMLEVHQYDGCDDFYYISRGWGLYLTVNRSFDLPAIYDAAAKEKNQVRCATHFYVLSHSSEQHPKNECTIQIPKTDNFARVGTVLVFARKNVQPDEESPDPDDSAQEYLISDDMKTAWGTVWLNQERNRWSLIDAGIANKSTRVVFKSKVFTAYVVVQLNSGTEKSEREDDDDESSDEEEPDDDSGSKAEEDEDKEERDEKTAGATEGAEETEPTEGTGEGQKKGKKKKRRQSIISDILGLDEEMCVYDEPDVVEEQMIAEIGEGEGEEGAEDVPGPAADGAGATEDSGEPGAPNPSPMVNVKEEGNKDENASNVGRPWSPAGAQGSNNNNINQADVASNKNNNQIRDNDEDFDQSGLAPEERTVVVGLPPLPTSFAKLPIAPSVYRVQQKSPPSYDEDSDQPETEDRTSESNQRTSTLTEQRASLYPSMPDEFPIGSESASRAWMHDGESDEELPEIIHKKLSIAVMKNGVKKTQDFKFGPKLSSLPLEGVDMDHVKMEIAQMWRLRNHKKTCVLIFSRPRGDGEFDMIIDAVQTRDTYVRSESHYSEGFKMVGESVPMPIKTGRLLSFTVEGPLIVEKCKGGIVSQQGNPKTRTLYFSHSKINSIEYVVKRPQVEEVKGPTSKKGKKKEEVKVELEPDARLEVMALNAGSGTNGVDLASLPIWLTGTDLWMERHVQLRASDNILLGPIIECLGKSRALARCWWRLLILLGFPEKDVETEKAKTDPSLVVTTYVRRWFEDCLNHNDRGVLRLVQALNTLHLDVCIDNVVKIIRYYKSHLLRQKDRPRYLKLLFHWVLQTKISRNNLLRQSDPPIMRPVSDVFLLFLSDFLPKAELFKIGAAMDVEENVLHAISGEEIIKDEAYLGFRVLVKSRQKKDEIIHYTLLLMEMFKQVELPEAHDFMVNETKKWMETVAESDPEVCSKLENVFG